MFRRLRVGTKLVAVLVPPSLVLALLAGLGVRNRLERAAEASRAGDVAAVARVSAVLGHQLQIEQLLAATVAGSEGASSTAELASAVELTDAAVALYRDALGDADLEGMDDRLEIVDDRLTALAGLRDRTQSGEIDLAELTDAYALAELAVKGTFDDAAAQNVPADISEDASFTGTLAGAKASRAQVLSQLAYLGAAGDLAEVDRDAVLARVGEAQAEADRRYLIFFELADSEFKALLRNQQAAPAARTNDELTEAATRPTGATVDLGAFLQSSEARLAGELSVFDEVAGHMADEADEIRAAANRATLAYIAGALAAIAAALALAYVVARSVTRPLRQLTAAASSLASDQLPALVERLHQPDADISAIRPVPIEVKGRDEVAQLAGAFNRIQETTLAVADEQSSLLRRGISDMYVNLARRNQSLLDRQIAFIDELEASEADPDQLENLFRLDHLATRMRRNAESLLVLAGAEPPRRRGQPVSLSDVVRVAVGEVEDFTRIEHMTFDDVAVAAVVALDLSHLLAELMENATQFSPPDSMVEVMGHDSGGDFVLSVTDSGIGMGATALAELNAVLANPPVTGLALGRSLGAIVVGRLANRHGIRVQLSSTERRGTTALVNVPAALVTRVGDDEVPAVTDEVSAVTDEVSAAAEPATAAAEPAAGAAEPAGLATQDDPDLAPEPASRAEPTSEDAADSGPGVAGGSDGASDAVLPAVIDLRTAHGPFEVLAPEAERNGLTGGADVAVPPLDAADTDHSAPDHGASSSGGWSGTGQASAPDDRVDDVAAAAEGAPQGSTPTPALDLPRRTSGARSTAPSPTDPAAAEPPIAASADLITGPPAEASPAEVELREDEAAEVGVPPEDSVADGPTDGSAVEPVPVVVDEVPIRRLVRRSSEDGGESFTYFDVGDNHGSERARSRALGVRRYRRGDHRSMGVDAEPVGDAEAPSVSSISEREPTGDEQVDPRPIETAAETAETEAPAPTAAAHAEAPTDEITPTDETTPAAEAEPAIAASQTTPDEPAVEADIDLTALDRPAPATPARPVANVRTQPVRPPALSNASPLPRRRATQERTVDATAGVGLARRSPREQVRSMQDGDGDGAEAARVMVSQRSPEEVRRMLSRYRTGLQRGRLGGATNGTDTAEDET